MSVESKAPDACTKEAIKTATTAGAMAKAGACVLGGAVATKTADYTFIGKLPGADRAAFTIGCALGMAGVEIYDLEGKVYDNTLNTCLTKTQSQLSK